MERRMSHNTRAGLISAAAAILAALVFIEAQPLLVWLSGPDLPGWLEALRAFIVPLVAYGSGYAAHYLLTRNAEPPLPAGLEEGNGQIGSRE
jgi:hypothetical protein